MLLRNGKRKLDAYRPTFDPNVDIATVVFSHVQCVRTCGNLAQVSRIWRDASKISRIPDRFDFYAFPSMDGDMQLDRVMCLLENDEALRSLPYEKVVELLVNTFDETQLEPLVSSSPSGTAERSLRVTASTLGDYAAHRGSVRLLKWMRVKRIPWTPQVRAYAARKGHLSVLKYLDEKRWPCGAGSNAMRLAADYKHWHCLQYMVDNKCGEWWKYYAEKYAEHLR